MQSSNVEDVIVRLLSLAVTDLPKDVRQALQLALKKESNSTARNQLQAILENIKLAKEHSIPMCQDTGIQIFYITVGRDFPLLGELSEILTRAVRRATLEIPLRPNTVDPIHGKNPGDNTGHLIPWINWKITKGTDLEITAFPKGGGSENVCQLGMLTPGKGIKGMKRFVIDSLLNAGAKPCPPTIIGIGIGGGADISMKLGKEALLRPVGERHKDPEIAKLELELLEAANTTGIGPMGLGGDTTVLDVHISIAMRHPASYPVGIAFQCWAARRATVKISKQGKIKFMSHEVEWS